MTHYDNVHSLWQASLNDYVEQRIAEAVADLQTENANLTQINAGLRERNAQLESLADGQANTIVLMDARIRELEDELYGNGQGPTPALDRDTLVYGTYEPGESTTGPVPGTELTDYNAPGTEFWTVPAGTTLIENKTIYGDLRFNRDWDVTIRNCVLMGSATVPTNTTAVVDARPAHTGKLTLTDCRIMALEPKGREGVLGYGVEVYRCHISDVMTGIDASIPVARGTDARVVAKGNMIHHLAYSYPWLSLPEGTRNDGLVAGGGGNVTFVGNYVNLRETALNPSNTGPHPTRPWLTDTQQNNGYGFMMGDHTGAGFTSGPVKVTDNYFAGGLAHVFLKSGSVVELANRHYRDTATNASPAWPGYWIRVESRANVTFTGASTWSDGPYVGDVLTEPRDRGIVYNS